LILSAKHGVLDPEQSIAPYDVAWLISPQSLDGLGGSGFLQRCGRGSVRSMG